VIDCQIEPTWASCLLVAFQMISICFGRKSEVFYAPSSQQRVTTWCHRNMVLNTIICEKAPLGSGHDIAKSIYRLHPGPRRNKKTLKKSISGRPPTLLDVRFSKRRQSQYRGSIQAVGINGIHRSPSRP
jgi:hypothetical protein